MWSGFEVVFGVGKFVSDGEILCVELVFLVVVLWLMVILVGCVVGCVIGCVNGCVMGCEGGGMGMGLVCFLVNFLVGLVGGGGVLVVVMFNVMIEDVKKFVLL